MSITRVHENLDVQGLLARRRLECGCVRGFPLVLSSFLYRSGKDTGEQGSCLPDSESNAVLLLLLLWLWLLCCCALLCVVVVVVVVVVVMRWLWVCCGVLWWLWFGRGGCVADVTLTCVCPYTCSHASANALPLRLDCLAGPHTPFVVVVCGWLWLFVVVRGCLWLLCCFDVVFNSFKKKSAPHQICNPCTLKDRRGKGPKDGRVRRRPGAEITGRVEKHKGGCESISWRVPRSAAPKD